MSYLTEDEYNTHLNAMVRSPYLVVDTEGTLNHPFSQTWGISTCTENGISEYFGFGHMLGENLPYEWLPKLRNVIEDHPVLVMHNAKHDIKALRNLDIRVDKFYDTMLMVHMTNENVPSKELDYLSKMMGFEGKYVTKLMQDIIDSFGWEYIPVHTMREYADRDAVATNEIFKEVKKDFDAQGFDGEYWDLEQEFINIMGELEDTGIVLDKELCEKEYERGTGIMYDIRKRLGFNPGSPKELAHFLLEEMKLPVIKRSANTGKPGFDKEVMAIYEELLGKVNDTRARDVLIYRGWGKTTSTNYKNYLEELYSEDGRLRPNYKLHGTVTGRMSCSYFQQIPRSSNNDWNGHLKNVFIQDSDFSSWEFDYRQLEFRLGLVYAIKSGAAGQGEHNLVEIFADPKRDVFREMGKQLNMIRQDVKTLQYTLQYGGAVDRIHDVFNVSYPAAQAIRDNYYRNYPGFGVVANVTKRMAEQRGWIKYWSGRRRHFRFKNEARKAGNSLTQGGAAEIIKHATVKLKRKGLIVRGECEVNLQVHDSLRFDILKGKEKEYIPEIIETMEDVKLPWETGVQFQVEVNKWGTEEKWNND